MDRNSLIGFGLLVLLAIGYVSYNQYSQTKYQEQVRIDSIANAKLHPQKPKPIIADTAKQQSTIVDAVNDSIRKAMPPAYNGKASLIELENKDIKLSFSTKGAHPTAAWLKGYKTHDDKPLYLFNGNGNLLSALLPINNNSTATADLYYTATSVDAANGGKSIDFAADLGNGKAVHFTYLLPAEGYMMSCKMTLTGITAATVPMTWQTSALNTEKDIQPQQTNSQVYYSFTDKDHDYFSFINKQKEELTKPVHWIGFRLQYFSTALVAEKEFNRVTVAGNAKLQDSTYVAVSKNTFDVALSNSNEQTANFNWYIGPNKYSILKKYGNDLEEMVPLGYGLMAFVKYVNKWLIIPIFNVLSGFISNYGIIIILMTLFIRLILSFFTYKSYLSAAKMRVLKPELDELRAKLGDDQQKFSMEQMKLYRTAGVNPLGGCLPTLFQLPILFAMYYFFPSSIELRQQKFLWANDLSTYDSLISWSGDIPVISSIFGNHISLFTILMTASSLFLALYNRNMTVQDPNNPMMKWMPYIFPFLLFGVFNKMAAALTFYYFCSNMISIAQQFVIQKYIIDEKAIHAQMQENKNKPATPSKWAAKMEELQKSQQERAKQLPRKK